eukprot:653646-Pleurochrysis_carterae.AAC.1
MHGAAVLQRERHGTHSHAITPHTARHTLAPRANIGQTESRVAAGPAGLRTCGVACTSPSPLPPTRRTHSPRPGPSVL